MEEAYFLFQIVCVLYLGLVLGSFSTALVHRIPRGIPWAWDSSSNKKSQPVYSSCVSCGHRLSVLDLVPVLSWLFLRGRCRHCGTKIGAHYLLIESLTLFLCLLVFLFWGLNVASILIIFMIPFLVALFVIDLQHMILPNQLVFIVGLFAVLFAFWKAFLFISEPFSFDSLFKLLPQIIELVFLPYLIGAFVFAFVAWSVGKITTFLLKREALGFGDVKFFFVSGLWLGIAHLPYFMMMSGVGGILCAVLWKFKGEQGAFPFGPALIFALFFGINFQKIGFLP